MVLLLTVKMQRALRRIGTRVRTLLIFGVIFMAILVFQVATWKPESDMSAPLAVSRRTGDGEAGAGRASHRPAPGAAPVRQASSPRLDNEVVWGERPRETDKVFSEIRKSNQPESSPLQTSPLAETGGKSNTTSLPLLNTVFLLGMNVSYMGCYHDNVLPNRRALQDDFFADYRRMTIEKCLAHCRRKGLYYVGLEFGGECYCGKNIHAVPVPTRECNMTCPGRHTSRVTCGGVARIAIYRMDQKALEKIHKERLKQRAIPIPTIADSYRGCFRITTAPEQISPSPPWQDDRLSPVRCVQRCTTKLFTLAVMGNFTTCQCANVTAGFRISNASGDENCNYPCAGNEEQRCGGPGHASIYRTNVEDVRCSHQEFIVPDHSRPLIALASFPGSGNTWVRHLIEKATGIYTGSFYNDGDLYLKGFKGERENWRRGNTIVVKTHRHDEEHIQTFDGAILLIRNPYRAIQAEHNRRLAGHTGLAGAKSYWTQEWVGYVKGGSQTWANTALEWIKHCKKLFVIHYEDLRKDLIGQIKRILTFLEVPVSEERLLCVETDKDGKFKRRRHLDFDPYKAEMHEAIDIFIRSVGMALQLNNLTKIPQEYYPHDPV
ncbi:WSCD2 [Branchiostoma lanceolatum]|uniref:WSCD2 protein n=1 Tax=Branchiostoma lanceolatum TaxID=7740 RepID=A0A8J9YQE0_BRALA|nr:WSCD2 [Branchiostoma lanceolatum]